MSGKEAKKCKAGQVKHWVWDYQFHLEDGKGNVTQKPLPGWHAVAGVAGKNGRDPDDVYSKNGRRPVEGPDTGSGFRPAAREHATKNTPKAEKIYDRNKKPVYKARTDSSVWTFCLPCPK